MTDLQSALNDTERELVATLSSPARIQAFLDEVPYSTDPIYRSPLSVLRERRAHCVDGALFAAAALRCLGCPPLVVELCAERDDDHFLAVYRQGSHWGAVAKSNFVGLRFREPIYRSLRELVISYFEPYYNIEGRRSLRAYAGPVNLQVFDRLRWEVADDGLEAIVERIDRRHRHALLTPEMVARLSPVDKRSYEAGMLGTDMAGVYRP